MIHPFVIEPLTYTSFDNEDEQIEKCQEWSLLSEKATKTKVFYYKGHGMNLACSIIGYVDQMTAVIALENNQKHCIHPSYLKEMQAASYGQKPSTIGEESVNSESIQVESSADTVRAVEETTLEAPQIEPSVPKKAKKEKIPKPQLPEEKVKMIATVKEFATVPNHFSDTDDEVVIYEAVSFTESGTAIGDAWSSHSATLKKQELAVGDTITFEGKIVAKKLTKHPVPYKINNPAKIQKEQAQS